MCGHIYKMEKKYAKDKDEKTNLQGDASTFKTEATFYLEGTEPIYDLTLAIKDYKRDLMAEVEMVKKDREQKKLEKALKKANKGSKIGDNAY